MIIVSQNKNMIGNFNNITSLDIEKCNNVYYVECNFINQRRAYLGEYSTEERAKEVLQEIMKKYLDIKCFYNSKYEVMQTIEQPKIYEMPEE